MMTILSITAEAKQFLIKMLETKGLPAVELKLEPQGCNGYKYIWQPVALTEAEHTIELDQGYSLILQRPVIPYVLGSEVILEKDNFNKRLILNNPNAAGSCGCGESVNFK